MKDIKNCKRILIVGDSCRGKSTMAEFLSQKLNLKHIELDDVFWIKKFTERREKENQLKMVKQILRKNNEWIIEGTTRDIASMCMGEADLIIHMWFKNILVQLVCLFKRGYQKKEKLSPLLNLCYETVLKRYKLRKRNRGKPSVKDLVLNYPEKVINLSSWKSIEQFKESFGKD